MGRGGQASLGLPLAAGLGTPQVKRRYRQIEGGALTGQQLGGGLGQLLQPPAQQPIAYS